MEIFNSQIVLINKQKKKVRTLCPFGLLSLLSWKISLYLLYCCCCCDTVKTNLLLPYKLSFLAVNCLWRTILKMWWEGTFRDKKVGIFSTAKCLQIFFFPLIFTSSSRIALSACLSPWAVFFSVNKYTVTKQRREQTAQQWDHKKENFARNFCFFVFFLDLRSHLYFRLCVERTEPVWNECMRFWIHAQ